MCIRDRYRTSSSCVDCITHHEIDNGKNADASKSSKNSTSNTSKSSATEKGKVQKKKVTRKVTNATTGPKKKNPRLKGSKGYSTAGIRSSRRRANR